MNSAHFHLIITHLPILGTFFGLCLLLKAIGQKSRDLHRTSLWVFLVSGLVTVPTYLTGSPANTVLMRSMPGLSPDPGDQHAEVAVLALAAASVLGLLALSGLALYRAASNPPGRFTAAAVVLASATTALMIWTGSLGGGIRHAEIHDATASPSHR